MKDRIAKIIKKEHLTSQQFAEMVDMQSSTISHILAGRNLPSFKIISNLLEKFPDISPDWLIFGKGEMLRPKEKALSEVSSEEQISPIWPQKPLFTKVDLSEVEEAAAEPLNEDNETLSEAFNPIESPVIEEDNRIDTTTTTIAIPEKIIIMYSDKTFEVFNAK